MLFTNKIAELPEIVYNSKQRSWIQHSGIPGSMVLTAQERTHAAFPLAGCPATGRTMRLATAAD
jgi:hypothetical protein